MIKPHLVRIPSHFPFVRLLSVLATIRVTFFVVFFITLHAGLYRPNKSSIWLWQLGEPPFIMKSNLTKCLNLACSKDCEIRNVTHMDVRIIYHIDSRSRDQPEFEPFTSHANTFTARQACERGSYENKYFAMPRFNVVQNEAKIKIWKTNFDPNW